MTIRRAMKYFIAIALLISITVVSYSQDNADVIQYSGRVITMDEGEIQRLIYTNIAVKGTSRGTVSDIDGFFSLPVREGETILVSRIGYQDAEVQIPDEVDGTFYSKDVIMTEDTLFLPEALIYPWPDKDFFKIEFLALEVDNVLEDLAAQNLAPEKIEFLRAILPADGGEVSKIELQQAYQAYYYNGQARPMNVFNPLSWKKFIDAIRRGDYKKKD